MLMKVVKKDIYSSSYFDILMINCSKTVGGSKDYTKSSLFYKTEVKKKVFLFSL